MAIISTNTTLTGSAFNEAFTVTSNATLTINPANFTTTVNPFGTFSCTTIGTIEIINTSSTVPYVLELATSASDFQFEGNGKMIISGSLIQIGTGTGLANQTIDFSNIGGVSIDWPSCVWVESGSDNRLYPYQNLGTTVSGSDFWYLPLSGSSQSLGKGAGISGSGGVMGDFDSGRYFNFETSSRIATFGDGEFGAVIPNGSRILFPNIHITGTSSTDIMSKNTFDLNQTGDLNFKNVNFGRAVNFGQQQRFIDVAMENVSFSNVFGLSNGAGDVYIRNLSCSPCTDSNISTNYSSIFIIGDISGYVDIDGIYYSIVNLRNGGQSFDTSIGSISNLIKFNNVYCNSLSKLGTSLSQAIGRGSINGTSNAILKNWTWIGNAFPSIQNKCTNMVFSGIKHSSTPFKVTITSSAAFQNIWSNQAVFRIVNTSGITIAGLRSLPSGSPMTASLLIDDGGYNTNLQCIDWDYRTEYSGSIWSTGLISPTANTNAVFRNIYIDRVSSPNGIFPNQGSPLSRNFILDNVRGPYNNNVRPTSGLRVVFAGVANPFTGIAGGVDTGPYYTCLIDTNQRSGSSGVLFIGPFQQETTKDYYYSNTTGSTYFNNAGFIYITEIGSYAEFTNSDPIVGITSIPTSSIRYTTNAGSGLSGSLSIEYEMVNYGNSFTGTMTQMTPTNVSNSFAALTNYNSNNGFNMKTRITALTSSVLTYINQISISCSLDPNYTAKDSFITFNGGDQNSIYRIFNNSTDTQILEFTGSGIHYFNSTGLVGIETYTNRYTLFSGSLINLATSKLSPIELVPGNNGSINLYVGNEVQVASSDPSNIWNYTTRTITEGTFTDLDRTQLNKTLTTGKFIALK
jgi:hypothetical protein